MGEADSASASAADPRRLSAIPLIREWGTWEAWRETCPGLDLAHSQRWEVSGQCPTWQPDARQATIPSSARAVRCRCQRKEDLTRLLRVRSCARRVRPCCRKIHEGTPHPAALQSVERLLSGEMRPIDIPHHDKCMHSPPRSALTWCAHHDPRIQRRRLVAVSLRFARGTAGRVRSCRSSPREHDAVPMCSPPTWPTHLDARGEFSRLIRVDTPSPLHYTRAQNPSGV
jgi:hypothetical protein